MKFPFAIIIGKSTQDIAREEVAQMGLDQAARFAFDAHPKYSSQYNDGKFRLINPSNSYEPVTRKRKDLPIRVYGNFDEVPKGWIQTKNNERGLKVQGQIVLLDKGIYFQKLGEYIRDRDLVQGIAFADPFIYKKNHEKRETEKGEIGAGATICESFRKEYSAFIGNRDIYRSVANQMLDHGSTYLEDFGYGKDKLTELVVLCENEDLAELARDL